MPQPLTRTSRAAAPLPDPYAALANSRYHARLRRGEVVMVAGPPGAGKSVFALVAALRLAEKGVPCLYISADSNEATMAARAAAAVTGHPVDTVAKTIEVGLWGEEYAWRLADLPIRFEYDDTDPSINDIANGLTAFLEVWGEAPHLIILDNLMNMNTGDSNEWQGMRGAVKQLHYVARKSKSCVLVLHHTSEQESAHVESAPPRGAIQGKVSQLPALILTVANRDGELFVGVVKNRHGPADVQAREPVRMICDFATCQVYDVPLHQEVSRALAYA